jgi:hypothetical protein
VIVGCVVAIDVRNAAHKCVPPGIAAASDAVFRLIPVPLVKVSNVPVAAIFVNNNPVLFGAVVEEKMPTSAVCAPAPTTVTLNSTNAAVYGREVRPT